MAAMGIKRVIATGLAVGTLCFAVAGNARAQTLADALASAYQNSGLLGQNRALLRAADEDVAQTIAALRPVVDYTASSNYSSLSDSFTTSLGISASMLLYDFGGSTIRTDLAKENVLSLRETLIGVEQDVLLRAVSAYVAVQRDISFVSLSENNQRVITQELRAARDRFDLGEITRTDVSSAEARFAATKGNLALSQGNLASSREEYRAAIGSYPEQLAALPALPATATSLEAARNVARLRHPDMLQAQRGVVIADLNVAAAAAAMKPSVRGSANVALDQDGQGTHSLGIALAGPIYRGGQLASSYRRAAAQRDASRAVLHLTRLSVDQNVGNAWSRLTVSNAQLQARDQEIRAASVAFEGVREEAALGARTTLDVLDAEQELLDARSSRVSAQSDRYVAVYTLLEAMGLLTVEHLRLGIATYDPAAYYNAVKAAPTYKVSPQGKKLDSVLKALGKK